MKTLLPPIRHLIRRDRRKLPVDLMLILLFQYPELDNSFTYKLPIIGGGELHLLTFYG